MSKDVQLKGKALIHTGSQKDGLLHKHITQEPTNNRKNEQKVIFPTLWNRDDTTNKIFQKFHQKKLSNTYEKDWARNF